MGPGEAPDRLRHLSPEQEIEFPNLRAEVYHVTSEFDPVYNCIAFAAGWRTVWWWPTELDVEGCYWPPGVLREETVEAFIQAYGSEDYSPCLTADLEPGYEKVALFTNAAGVPQHAAWQLESGTWKSKLGKWPDIEHATLEAVAGGCYGEPTHFLKRRRRHSTLPTRSHGLRRTCCLMRSD